MTGSFHPGELAVQQRAGVQEMARRVGGMIRAAIPPAAAEFLARQPMVVLGAADGAGRVWATLLTGRPGFLRAESEEVLSVGVRLSEEDPLASLEPGAEVGLLGIEPESRRRMRLNGIAQNLSPEGFQVQAREVFSNCPKYIQARRSFFASAPEPPHPIARRSGSLSDGQMRWIGQADTLFIASLVEGIGADVSHRGGQPGFVSVLDPSRLLWPDYPGNNLFQTFGNLAASPRAGLLFLDFDGGHTLQLTGTAEVLWQPERAVRFEIEEVVEQRAVSLLRWELLGFSPFNPTVTGEGVHG